MIDITSKPILVAHYRKVADELNNTAEHIAGQPGTSRDLAPKLRLMAKEIRQNLDKLQGERPAAAA